MAKKKERFFVSRGMAGFCVSDREIEGGDRPSLEVDPEYGENAEALAKHIAALLNKNPPPFRG